MRRVLTGGAPISEIDIKEFCEISPNSENWVLYGSTEVEPIAFIESREMLSIKSTAPGKNTTEVGVNVGRIDAELSYKLIEIDQGNINPGVAVKDLEVKEGQVGELIVSGENVCRNYYNNENAFLRAKIKDNNGAIWHRTGDIGRMDGQGYLWIVGRIHSVVEKDGKYFFPVRPEIMLKDIPGVVNSAYLSTAGKIIAVVTVANNADNERSRNNIFFKIKQVFKEENIPIDEIVFKRDIPMDVRHHSKVNYNKLREELLEDDEI